MRASELNFCLFDKPDYCLSSSPIAHEFNNSLPCVVDRLKTAEYNFHLTKKFPGSSIGRAAGC